MTNADALAIATAATGVATALFTGYAIWQRHRDRPKPSWQVTRTDVNSPYGAPKDEVDVGVQITNVGDGTAYNVTANVIGRTSSMRTRNEAAVLTGGFVAVYMTVAGQRAGDYDVESDTHDPPERVDLSDHAVIVQWSPPGRPKRRPKKVIRLGEFSSS